MTGKSAQGTGDINLAAAILSMGVAPAAGCPVKLLVSDHGEYVRFNLAPVSDDGKYSTMDLMAGWANRVAFKAENPKHPFTFLMDFIASKPDGSRSRYAWLEHAASFLGLTVDAVRTSIADAKRICAANPESPASYVIAMLANRDSLVDTAKRARDGGLIDNYIESGPSVGLISERLPKKTRDNLLKHLK